MVHIITISVSDNDYEFLKRHKKDKDCSPSYLLRHMLHQKKQEYGEEIAETLEDVKNRLKANIEIRDSAMEFIKMQGDSDAWLQFMAKKGAIGYRDRS